MPLLRQRYSIQLSLDCRVLDMYTTFEQSLTSAAGSCRAGRNCPFLHEDPPNASSINAKSTHNETSQSSDPTTSNTTDELIQDRRQRSNQVQQSRVVLKPIPQAQVKDPREFQLGQIRKRFSPKESRNGDVTVLKYDLAPSDPDFPFEMSALKCVLSVPPSYPMEFATLRVESQDIPRGFAINVETGFAGLYQEHPKASLLDLMKLLDRHLETFLSAPKAETVKLVANKDTRHLSALPSRSLNIATQSSQSSIIDTEPVKAQKSTQPIIEYSPQQKAEAAARREAETRQLEARMGRVPLFKKSGDGIAYTVPVEPRRRSELPVSLQAVKTVQLFVPLLYPLQPCRIQLDGVDAEEAKPVQLGFEQKAKACSETTLMGHVNYLAQNIHILERTVVEEATVPEAQISSAPPAPEPAKSKGKEPQGTQDPERSHIQYITRPPEWTIVEHGDSDLDSEDDYSYDSGDESSGAEGGALVQENAETAANAATANVERGTALSFPFIELYGIELLELVTLNLTVKCERCRETNEVKGLKDGTTKQESCKKCASPISIGFRREFVHANAVRAGFLDLDGCIVADMLPSSFIPTCSECSTAYPTPGLTSVQGETTNNVCRECHKKFTFKIPQVKFLRISATSHLPPSSGPRRKKETLGLTPGTELPKRGRCRHYTKSYRWFRFSCCQKVYACDKCHDEAEDHVNEWANRMICGWCSREGNYRPEDCGFCHGLLIGKKGGGGFWEGGKGTRDKVRMSRKDPRKYRRPAAAVKKQ